MIHKRWKRTRSGFTIVELLIVIVVIAILAAITIVSYNGIQAQAQNAKVLSSIDAYTKALRLYKAQNGTYPSIVESETQSAAMACLGYASDFPANSTYPAGGCYVYPAGSIDIRTSTSLMNALAQTTSNLPSATLPSVTLTTNQSIRGFLYMRTGDTAVVEYIQKGDVDCARGSKSYNGSSFPNMTDCMIALD